MDMPVAIITGACSDVGLGLTRHLLAKQWRVVIADITATEGHELAATLGPNVLFVEVNVCSWTSQVALFERAYEWGGGRLDFFAANAWISDPENLFMAKHYKESELPQKPNLLPIEVIVNGTIYGLKLYAYYVQKSGRAGKAVISASVVGTLPLIPLPLYTAAKHSLIGLTRALGPLFKVFHNIAINAISPGFVTPSVTISHDGLVAAKYLTPMKTIMNMYDVYLLDDKQEKFGQILEASGENFGLRSWPSPLDELQNNMWFDPEERIALRIQI